MFACLQKDRKGDALLDDWFSGNRDSAPNNELRVSFDPKNRARIYRNLPIGIERDAKALESPSPIGSSELCLNRYTRLIHSGDMDLYLLVRYKKGKSAKQVIQVVLTAFLRLSARQHLLDKPAIRLVVENRFPIWVGFTAA